MRDRTDKKQENAQGPAAIRDSHKNGGGTFQLVDNRPATDLSRLSQRPLQRKPEEGASFEFEDNRPETVQLRAMQGIANNSRRVQGLAARQEILQKKGPEDEEELQLEFDKTVQRKGPLDEEELQLKAEEPVQKQENRTGLPDNLKTGMENLSGMSLDDVKVHRNSDKPAQLQAHAYAQGTDIHIGPGQEKHLPHEAWHVVQQKEGRVKPTMQIKSKVNLNDDPGLEKEADVMGAKSLQMKPKENPSTMDKASFNLNDLNSNTVQKAANNNVIQKYSVPLHEAITAIGDYAFKDPFMQYTAATNESPEAVNWKAHVGVQDAKDRAQVLAEAGPVLRARGLNHKFDIRDAEDGTPFQKFITIYPPAEESDWAGIIAGVESAISVATYFDENAEAGVMGGKVAMRHGQIGAVIPAQIIEAGIELTKGATANSITNYVINDVSKVWDAAFKDKLVFHSGAGACFFMMERPFPAIIWEGMLRPDRREHWNPFEAKLPEGVKTSEEIEWEEKIIAYRSSEMYRNRERALIEKGEAGRYGI